MEQIIFLGDSITEGYAASTVENRYVNLVEKMCHIKCINFGVSGTRIAKQFKPTKQCPRFDEYFLLRAKKMPKNADMVFVFGGTNDFGHGDAPFGNVGDKTSLTFCGALNNLYRYLKNKYGEKKIYVILPLHRSDENEPYPPLTPFMIKNKGIIKLKMYVEVIKNYAQMYNFNVLDFSDALGCFPNSPNFIEDGLHPNDNGHKLLALLISNVINEKLNTKEEI